jgi:hypothetical protein
MIVGNVLHMEYVAARPAHTSYAVDNMLEEVPFPGSQPRGKRQKKTGK